MNRRALAVVASMGLGCESHPTTFDASVTDGPEAQDVRNCTAFCPASSATVLVDLGCIAANMTDASLSTACAPPDGGTPFSCATNDCKHLLFQTAHIGPCVVSLAFDDGFAYSAQVDIAQGPGDVCCAGMFTATPSDLVVTEPDASCADAGDAD